MYSNKLVMQAFKIYQILRREGKAGKEDVDLYQSDDMLRSLLEEWAKEEACTIRVAGQRLYLIPLATYSPYHMTNEEIKKAVGRTAWKVMDIYLMYFSMIVLIGSFYDSFNTTAPTRDFISLDQWLEEMNKRLHTIAQHGDKLEAFEQEYEYNWLGILEKWTSLDDIKEGVKSQKGNTSSRKNFLLSVNEFLKNQELVEEKGFEELYLTEKAHVIVGHYFMDEEYNRGILEVIYGYEEGEEE